MQPGINAYLHLNLCVLYVWGVFLSGSIYNVYCVSVLRQTPHPFVYCFNIHLIYRFRSCLFAQQRNWIKGAENIKTVHEKNRTPKLNTEDSSAKTTQCLKNSRNKRVLKESR